MLSFRRRATRGPAFEEIYLDIVAPFRAWRYSPQAGELTHLVAPPYDVIGPDLQSRLYASSPYNVVRVDLGRTTQDDDESDNQYTRAAALLTGWKEAGVLARDRQPSITFVEESFTGPDGVAGRRHGILAAMRLSEFGEGVVFPHEHTLTGPKEDRFRLMRATAMSLSPVFLLYDLPADDITAAWKTTLSGRAPSATTIDEAGNATHLWPTFEPGILNLVTRKLAGSRLLVADGHHRYETALRYRQTWRQESGAGAHPKAASDYCLVYLVNMRDPALAIYPTHRLVAGIPTDMVLNLPRSLAETFVVEPLLDPTTSTGGGAATLAGSAAQEAIALYLRRHPRGAFGLWSPLLDSPYGLRLADPAAAQPAPEHSAAYQELDVTILQGLILEKRLGLSAADMAAEKHVSYFKDAAEAFAKLEAGDFQLGFFMNSTGLDQVSKVAFGGERMPQKTTFFYPKLPTGLVFHDLTGRL